MSFFQWHVVILGSQIHVFSLLAVSFCLWSMTTSQTKHPIYIRMINSLLLVLLGHFIYEDIFILAMGTVGRSIDALWLFVAITIGIVAIIIIVDKEYPSFEADRDIFLLIFVLLGLFGFMYYTGWFHKLQLWYIGEGPDPHNLLWAISKFAGFIIAGPLIREENIR